MYSADVYFLYIPPAALLIRSEEHRREAAICKDLLDADPTVAIRRLVE
jgi:hypothetical protein